MSGKVVDLFETTSARRVFDLRRQAAQSLREIAAKLALPRYPTPEQWREIVEQQRVTAAAGHVDELASRRKSRDQS